MALSKLFAAKILDSILNDSYNINTPAPVNRIKILSGGPAAWGDAVDSWTTESILEFENVGNEGQMQMATTNGSSITFSVPAGQFVGRIAIGCSGLTDDIAEIMRFNANPDGTDVPLEYSIAGDYTVSLIRLKIANDVLN